MMRRAISLIGIFCISTLLFMDANAKGKPDKPDKSQAETIIFYGDLGGAEDVVGCCPNAGPFPEYTMTLGGVFGDLAGTYNGHLFINHYGAGKNHKYIVQFWRENEFFIQIIGGDVVMDRKTKHLTVTFEDEDYCVFFPNEEEPIVIEGEYFVLERYPAD